MLSVSRSRDDALVQDLEAALRLAIQQSQLTGSVQPVVTALREANEEVGVRAEEVDVPLTLTKRGVLITAREAGASVTRTARLR